MNWITWLTTYWVPLCCCTGGVIAIGALLYGATAIADSDVVTPSPHTQSVDHITTVAICLLAIGMGIS